MSQAASARVQAAAPLSAPQHGLAKGIVEERYKSMTILRSDSAKTRRRVLYLNSYGMALAWRLAKQELYPGQHLWGCLELVRMGYEVAMPEEPNRNSRWFNYRRQDGRVLAFARRWLGREDIIYSAHTVLFWTPLMASVGGLRCPIVTLLYGRGENLRFVKGYRAVIGLTPAAAARARELAPQAKVVHLGWGVDLSFFPSQVYAPKWFLSAGKTRRDFETLCAAAARCPTSFRIINPDGMPGIVLPANVTLVAGEPKQGWEGVPFKDLIHEHYAGCTAALILLEPDPQERFAAGFTQLLEAMALARPVIVTRTGALAGEIDVEKEGCGLSVPPNDPAALAKALASILEDPRRAQAMGQRGRLLCEHRYNINDYAKGLHRLFESL